MLALQPDVSLFGINVNEYPFLIPFFALLFLFIVQAIITGFALYVSARSGDRRDRLISEVMANRQKVEDMESMIKDQAEKINKKIELDMEILKKISAINEKIIG